MNNINYKKFILGLFSAGILLIIIQFLIRVDIVGNISYLIGTNLALVLKTASIINSMIALKKGKYIKFILENINFG